MAPGEQAHAETELGPAVPTKSTSGRKPEPGLQGRRESGETLAGPGVGGLSGGGAGDVPSGRGGGRQEPRSQKHQHHQQQHQPRDTHNTHHSHAPTPHTNNTNVHHADSHTNNGSVSINDPILNNGSATINNPIADPHPNLRVRGTSAAPGAQINASAPDWNRIGNANAPDWNQIGNANAPDLNQNGDDNGERGGEATQHTPSALSKKLWARFVQKPTLTRTWEKPSFAQERARQGQGGELSELGSTRRSPRGSPTSPRRPTSLYASPAALAHFHALPPVSMMPLTPVPPGAGSAAAATVAPTAVPPVTVASVV